MDQTEGALLPFWSPDSQFIGFWAGGQLKKIRRSGGPAAVICNVPEIAQGTWGRDGTILFAKTVNSPIFRVSRRHRCDTGDLVASRTGQSNVGPVPAGWRTVYLFGPHQPHGG